VFTEYATYKCRYSCGILNISIARGKMSSCGVLFLSGEYYKEFVVLCSCKMTVIDIDLSAGLKQSTCPWHLRVNSQVGASRFFASLARPGECFPPGTKWLSCSKSLTLVSDCKTICLTMPNFYYKKHEHESR